jgi:hypothetical protein
MNTVAGFSAVAGPVFTGSVSTGCRLRAIASGRLGRVGPVRVGDAVIATGQQRAHATEQPERDEQHDDERADATHRIAPAAVAATRRSRCGHGNLRIRAQPEPAAAAPRDPPASVNAR